MVVEIPKGCVVVDGSWFDVCASTNAKLEISKSVKGNPIVQDIKDGLLRYASSRQSPILMLFGSTIKHGDLPWNYGALPQTYDAPDLGLFGVKEKGDEDPVDVVEIGSTQGTVGDVVKVKVLGAFCLIDQGEADWKVVAINVDDPLAQSMHGTRSQTRDSEAGRYSRR